MIRNKEQFSFVISETSVQVIKRHNQEPCLSFNVYNAQSRHKFNNFRETLAKSPKNKYDNFNDLYGLAIRHQIRGSSGHRITIHKNIAY
jgi:hypothetical protein